MTDKDSDFNPAEIIKNTNRHDKDINYLKKKVAELDGKVGNDHAFARTFSSSQQNSTVLNDVIYKVIDKHDNHNLKTVFLNALKWLGCAIIGAIITFLITQLTIIPRYSLQIEELRTEINHLQNTK